MYERLTCDEHFELVGRAYEMAPADELRSRRAIYAALGLDCYAATRADQLSGGTLAKLNLGLTLLPDPDVLLLDEPYAGFDRDTYPRFWDLVAQRRAGRPLGADHQPLRRRPGALRPHRRSARRPAVPR